MTAAGTDRADRTERVPAPTRDAVVRWSLGVVLVCLGVLVAALIAGKGAPQPVPAGLPDAGPVTGWGLPVVRVLADLAGFAVVGMLLAAAVLLPSPATSLAAGPARLVSLAPRVVSGWLAAVAVEAVLTLSDILGAPPGDVLDATAIRSFLGQTTQGRGMLVQLTLLFMLSGLVVSVRTSKGAALTCVLAVVAIAPPALSGHSADSGNHELAVASLLVHVVAASLWVGGLAALLAVASATGDLPLAVPRFSRLALWCFVAVAVSGVVNAGVRLGSIGPLFTTAYGGLVLGKVAALGVLGGFGWWHRRKTVAGLGEPSAAPARHGDVRLFANVAAAEVAVMFATVALAVGLSRTPTPVRTPTGTSAAADLLGFPMPPRPTVERLLFTFVPDGFAVTFVVLAAMLYGTGVYVLRRRGDHWPVGRILCWVAGLVVLSWATFGGLGRYSHVLFSAHMVAHMLLSMVAPIGLVLGAPITLALRTLPGPRVPGELGPRQLLLAALHSRVARVALHPLVVFAWFVGSLYALYFTGLFPTLMGNHLGHVAMEFHFVAIGFLFFFVLVGVDPAPTRIPPIARIGMLFAAMPFHAFFSIAVMGSDVVLARGYFERLHRPYSTDLLGDQHLGGGIGWALGELPVLLVLGAVFVQWVRSDAREAARFDRAADRRAETPERATDQSDDVQRYNDYLAALAQRHDRQQGGSG